MILDERILHSPVRERSERILQEVNATIHNKITAMSGFHETQYMRDGPLDHDPHHSTTGLSRRQRAEIVRELQER